MELRSVPSAPRARSRDRAQPSEDGRFLYYSKWLDLAPIARVPLEGGDEELVLEKRPGYVDWALWGRHLVYLLHSRGILEMIDLDTGETTLLHELPEDFSTRLGLAISPDGKWILLTRQAAESDVMLVESYLSSLAR